jgi:Undecaprenyl-phosphate glucose phosphotransferase
MIKQNQKIFNIILISLDMFVITFAMILAWFIRFETDLLGFNAHVGGVQFYLLPLIYILPLYLGLYYGFGLYDPQRTKRISSEAFNIFKINIIGILMVVTILFVINLSDYSRFMLAFFAIFSTGFSIVERTIIRLSLRYMRSKGYNIKYILVIGAGELGEKFTKRIKRNEHVGYNLIGFLDDNIKKSSIVAGYPVIGSIDDLEEVILKKPLDRIIITLSPRHALLLEHIVDICEKYGVKAEIVPDYYRYFQSKPYIDMIEDIPLINIRYVPLDNSFNKALKRFLDIILVIIGILLFSPLLIFTAIMVKKSSPGPIIFTQDRVGLHRSTFKMYKFRSMKILPEEEEVSQWTTEDDPRKTKFGTFIRKTSIDELPQLFNILKGDMSLIGPRPERPHFVEKFREEVPHYMIKHHVRPGMTGWAQIHGWRGNTSIKKRIEFDLYYVENWTLSLDVKIFLLTFIRGFTDDNAY